MINRARSRNQKMFLGCFFDRCRAHVAVKLVPMAERILWTTTLLLVASGQTVTLCQCCGRDFPQDWTARAGKPPTSAFL
jgi:hypothetical protein